MIAAAQYGNWWINTAVVILTISAVAASALVHYEGLS
jgi:hypothetical protein